MGYVLLAIIGCGASLVADAVPGFIYVWCCSGCFVSGIILSFVMVSIFVIWLDTEGRVAAPAGRRPNWRAKAVTGGVVLMSLMSSVAEVPKRFGLWLSRPAFEALLADAPKERPPFNPLGRWVGLYRIDHHAADAEGGVFFRTSEGQDGIGPDRMSYGFAYRPHHESCPFGHARYRTTHLFGDWYAFSVSDDY